MSTCVGAEEHKSVEILYKMSTNVDHVRRQLKI